MMVCVCNINGWSKQRLVESADRSLDRVHFVWSVAAQRTDLRPDAHDAQWSSKSCVPQIQIQIKIAVSSVQGWSVGGTKLSAPQTCCRRVYARSITGLILTDDGRQHRLRSLTYSTFMAFIRGGQSVAKQPPRRACHPSAGRLYPACWVATPLGGCGRGGSSQPVQRRSLPSVAHAA